MGRLSQHTSISWQTLSIHEHADVPFFLLCQRQSAQSLARERKTLALGAAFQLLVQRVVVRVPLLEFPPLAIERLHRDDVHGKPTGAAHAAAAAAKLGWERCGAASAGRSVIGGASLLEGVDAGNGPVVSHPPHDVAIARDQLQDEQADNYMRARVSE